MARWVAAAFLMGAGCALAGIVAGIVMVVGIRMLPAAMQDAQPARPAAPAGTIPAAMAGVAISPTATDVPALATASVGYPRLLATYTPLAAGVLDLTPDRSDPAPVLPSATATSPATAESSLTPARTATAPKPTHTPTPTKTPTQVPPTRTPTLPRPSPTSSSTPLPVPPSPTTPPVQSGGRLRVLAVGYAYSSSPNLEHIKLVNCDAYPINVENWQVRSVATTHRYTLPSYVAQPGCKPAVGFTVNTYTVGNENARQGIFTWGNAPGQVEWPGRPGRVELYDATGAIAAECGYQPDPSRTEVACDQP